MMPKRLEMPAWLEILLDLSGYAGFVALATCGVGCRDVSGDDQISDDQRQL
jgi:hypothetical protein